jgi:hypothetical protein
VDFEGSTLPNERWCYRGRGEEGNKISNQPHAQLKLVITTGFRGCYDGRAAERAGGGTMPSSKKNTSDEPPPQKSLAITLNGAIEALGSKSEPFQIVVLAQAMEASSQAGAKPEEAKSASIRRFTMPCAAPRRAESSRACSRSR